MFHKVSPVLPSLNLLQTSLFYRDKLGFEISYFANYLVTAKENIQLFFYEPKNKNTFQTLSCIIFVSNIEDLYAKFSTMGMIQPDGQLQMMPGNLTEFAITDNNGHQLKFAQKK